VERVGNGLPLRIEHRRLERHEHPCTHTVYFLAGP
jgi:hypothetical protein